MRKLPYVFANDTLPLKKRTPRVIIVACVANNNVIGASGKMPWTFPEDMRRFRQITMYKTVIMGNATYKSIGGPLYDRYNIVIGRPQEDSETLEFVPTFHDAIRVATHYNMSDVYVIGGQSVYEQAMPYADLLLLTEFYQDFDGDRFFPDIDLSEFKRKKCESFVNGTGMEYSFVDYSRIRR